MLVPVGDIGHGRQPHVPQNEILYQGNDGGGYEHAVQGRCLDEAGTCQRQQSRRGDECVEIAAVGRPPIVRRNFHEKTDYGNRGPVAKGAEQLEHGDGAHPWEDKARTDVGAQGEPSLPT